MLCKDKIRKQDVMVLTPPPPSQNYQEVELHFLFVIVCFLIYYYYYNYVPSPLSVVKISRLKQVKNCAACLRSPRLGMVHYTGLN